MENPTSQLIVLLTQHPTNKLTIAILPAQMNIIEITILFPFSVSTHFLMMVYISSSRKYSLGVMLVLVYNQQKFTIKLTKF